VDLETTVRWPVDKIYRPAALAAINGLLTESRADPRGQASDAAAPIRPE
jgi:hypothetical protein